MLKIKVKIKIGIHNVQMRAYCTRTRKLRIYTEGGDTGGIVDDMACVKPFSTCCVNMLLCKEWRNRSEGSHRLGGGRGDHAIQLRRKAGKCDTKEGTPPFLASYHGSAICHGLHRHCRGKLWYDLFFRRRVLPTAFHPFWSYFGRNALLPGNSDAFLRQGQRWTIFRLRSIADFRVITVGCHVPCGS